MNSCWTEQLIAHQLAYSFLSKVFYEAPEPELMQLLVEQSLFSDWPLDADDPFTQSGLSLLQGFCEQWDESQFPALKKDYAHLFIGPEALPAPPWESVYRSQDHLIFERQTLEVRQEYQRFGMPIPNLYSEPDDHIGLELRFIAYLCSAGLNALEQNQIEQLQVAEQEVQTFLNEHLLQWADEFLEKMLAAAHTNYYRGVAYLTRGALAQTARIFNATPQETLG